MQTNEHLEGRIYLIVLDDVHTDFTRTPRVKAAARRFIEQNFGTNDSRRRRLHRARRCLAGFHEQPAAADAAVDKFIGRKLRSATIERIEAARVNPATNQLEPGDNVE